MSSDVAEAKSTKYIIYILTDDASYYVSDHNQNQIWLGDDAIETQVPIADELVEGMDAPDSDGNSIDRFIRNGYTDDEMDDDEYLSDQSLKDFLNKLK